MKIETLIKLNIVISASALISLIFLIILELYYFIL